MKGNHLNALYLLTIASCYICNSVAEECYTFSGPSGARHCIFTRAGFQWGTCRSNRYLKEKSHGKYNCGHNLSFTTYCYVYCMYEMYGVTSGLDVYPSCECSPNDPEPTTYHTTVPTTSDPQPIPSDPQPTPSDRQPTPSDSQSTSSDPQSTPSDPQSTTYPPDPITPVTVPTWCYNPTGTICTWYKDCLNKAYPLCETENQYTINFLKTFCELHDQNLKALSSQGKKWLSAARKCLQDQMSPLLVIRVASCKYLRSVAMAKYKQCYRSPSPSYCNLSRGDRLAVFWHLRLNSASQNTYERGLKGVLDLMSECRNTARENSLVQAAKTKIQEVVRRINTTRTTNAINEKIQKAELVVWLGNPPTLPIQLDMFIKDDNSRFLRYQSLNEKSSFAGKIVDALALDQMWKDKYKGLVWFAHAVQDGKDISIRLLVTDRYIYGIPADGTLTTSNEFGAVLPVLEGLSEAVLKGPLNLHIDGESIEIIKLNGCLDWNCKEHAFNITSKSNAAESHSHRAAVHTLAYFALLVINYLFMS